jgi:uncharacterized membrane protein
MMVRTTVDGYLRELEEELRDLPPARRRELVEEIREHIESSLGESRDEAEVRNVLDRLGDPADIAAEARERFGIERKKPGIREILALILLPIGAFVIPVLGWFIGAVLLVSSTVWTSREKVIGLLVVPGGLLPAGLLGFMGDRSCAEIMMDGRVIEQTCSGGTLSIWLAYAILAVLVIAPIWTVFFLARRMNRRAATA